MLVTKTLRIKVNQTSLYKVSNSTENEKNNKFNKLTLSFHLKTFHEKHNSFFLPKRPIKMDGEGLFLQTGKWKNKANYRQFILK
jgi:hypothetical protein